MPSTSKPGQTEFVCFPCACLGSLGELQLHPTVQKHVCWNNCGCERDNDWKKFS